MFPYRWAMEGVGSRPSQLLNKDKAGLKSSTFGRKQYLPEME